MNNDAPTVRQRGKAARAATAYHEAGHAVAVWRHRSKLYGVTIKPACDALGPMHHDSPLRGINLDVDGSDSVRLRDDQGSENFSEQRKKRWGKRAENQ